MNWKTLESAAVGVLADLQKRQRMHARKIRVDQNAVDRTGIGLSSGVQDRGVIAPAENLADLVKGHIRAEQHQRENRVVAKVHDSIAPPGAGQIVKRPAMPARKARDEIPRR